MKMVHRYELTASQEAAIVGYLLNDLSLQDVAEILGYDRRRSQSCVNIIAAVCRQWVQEGKLVIK